MAAALSERNGIAIIDNDSSRNKKRTRRTRCSCSFSQLLRPPNKNLFFVFLTTVVFVSISIVFVSVVYLDDGNSNGDDGVNYHSIVAQLGGKTKSSDKEVEALSSLESILGSCLVLIGMVYEIIFCTKDFRKE